MTQPGRARDEGAVEKAPVPAWAVEFAEAEPGGAPLPEIFRTALRDAAAGILLADASGRILVSNPETWRLTGRSETELLGMPLRDVVRCGCDPVDPVALLSEGDRVRLDVVVVRPDGSSQLCDLTLSRTSDGSDDGLTALAVLHDTSALEGRLQQTRDTLRVVVDSLMDPWVLLAPVREAGAIVDFVYVDANEAAAAHNRTTRDALIGKHLIGIMPEHWDSGLFDAYVHVVGTGDPLALDEHPFRSILTTSDEIRWYDNRATRVGDALSLTWRDVSDRVTARHELTKVATTDHLTGVVNRAGFFSRAAATLAQHGQRSGDGLGILFIDVDGLKSINDALGHGAGDLVLASVAQRLSASVRGDDTVGRLGGDEFVVLATGLGGPADLDVLSAKLSGAVTAVVAVGRSHVTPRVSVGAAMMAEGEGVERAMERADQALYASKTGRLVGHGSVIRPAPDTVADLTDQVGDLPSATSWNGRA